MAGQEEAIAGTGSVGSRIETCSVLGGKTNTRRPELRSAYRARRIGILVEAVVIAASYTVRHLSFLIDCATIWCETARRITEYPRKKKGDHLVEERCLEALQME